MSYDAWKTRSPDDEIDLGEPPEVWEECPDCQGEGYVNKTIWVYEHGCAFGHHDVEAVLCETCGGAGGAIHEAVA